MRASSKRPRVKSSSGVASPHPPSSGDLIVDAYVDPTAAANPSPSTSNDSSYVGHCHNHSGGSWSALGGHVHGATDIACRVGEF